MTQHQDVTDVFVTASRALVSLAVRTIEEAPADVTLTQHRTLVLHAARGDLTLGDIAAGLEVNPSNASWRHDRGSDRRGGPGPGGVQPGCRRD